VAKIRGACEKCKEQMGQEIHHIQEQHRADENGFIGTFHKNHPANLMSVCKKCHDEFHTNISVKTGPTIMIKKKTTTGYRFLDNNTRSQDIT
jgi:DNA mismatch repair protein MutS